MASNRDRRTYDLLRLIDENEPIGSIRLVDQMQRRGYSIKGRTIRLMLSDLDESGLTEKVAGKGRKLTDAGRNELERGDVEGRRARVRERISTLTSQVTYDPTEDVGDLIVGRCLVPPDSLSTALDLLESLHDSSIGPVPLSIADDRNEMVEIALPSSISLDGVLLSRGIDVQLMTAGLVEYDGTVGRYVDTISGENATMDVVTLLIEAGRTNVRRYLESEMGILIVDNREFSLTRFEEARDLSELTRANLGGVLDLRRPREPGPFPAGSPGWDFVSLTYGGVGELALALLFEHGVIDTWDTLAELRPRSELAPVPTVRSQR